MRKTPPSLRHAISVGGSILPMIVGSSVLVAQQVADSAYHPTIEKRAFSIRAGPLILVDESHNNFHTASGRYLPFAQLLRRDGYEVEGFKGQFTPEMLQGVRILVIANARQPAEGVPAFADAELEAVGDWVEHGGSLLLIVDHPPFVEASVELGALFGVRFLVAGAADPTVPTGRLVFRRSTGTLLDHQITDGIEEVATFTGSSFQLDRPGQPLLVFGPGVFGFRERDDPSPMQLNGHVQGAVLRFGKGRVAVFAEAAMFSAQLTGPNRSPMGMNADIAKENYRFLLNVMHWLTGLNE